LSQHVGREVVDQAAVDEEMAVHPDRGEHTWNGHAGSHGGGHAAMTDVDFIARADVGGYASERDGQVVEIHLLLVSNAEVVEQVDERCVVDIGAGHEAHQIVVLLAQQTFEAERDVDQEGAVALPDLFRHGTAVEAVAHILPPIHVGDELGQLVGRVSHGIEAADDGSHAGACHVVDGDAYFFQILQNTNVGGAFGTATTKHHADFGPWCLDVDGLLVVLCLCA